ncbi:hypothetical protein [Kordia jejudonensis]|uniref:hypothetical protein n=1 Tax=Kordia jejudonensis TaxID=1348245 RepID=UPI0006299D90|nr:hypothetical protein [Kordia jejudonensis]
MKTVKTSGLLLILCLLFIYSCANKENKQSNNETKTESKKSTEKEKSNSIAKMEKGKIVFTDKKKLVATLEKSMGASRAAQMDMSTLKIDFSKATDNEKIEIVQLIVASKDKTEKTAYLLKRRGNEFEVSDTATIVSCTGCTVGCNPRRQSNGDGYCTVCTNDPEGKCEKTETLAATASVKQ